MSATVKKLKLSSTEVARAGKFLLYLWLCAAVSMALRGGVGDPCSVTLSTSKLFLSGRQRPCRVNIGESTRFLGGSVVSNYGHQVQKILATVLHLWH